MMHLTCIAAGDARVSSEGQRCPFPPRSPASSPGFTVETILRLCSEIFSNNMEKTEEDTNPSRLIALTRQFTLLSRLVTDPWGAKTHANPISRQHAASSCNFSRLSLTLVLAFLAIQGTQRRVVCSGHVVGSAPQRKGGSPYFLLPKT